MSKYTPERLRGLLPMPRLSEGERTEALRVRGPAEVLAWVLTLSPAERGAILSKAYSALAPAPAPDLDGVTVLRILAPTVPQGLRNKLRWPPSRYAQLEASLSAGDVLRLDMTNGNPVWRTVTGEQIRRDTVTRLVGVGVLRVEAT